MKACIASGRAIVSGVGKLLEPLTKRIQAVASSLFRAVDWFRAKPVMVGYTNPNDPNKPRLFVTSESSEPYLLALLQKRLNQPVIEILPNGGDRTDYNFEKDLLLLVIRKSKGCNPIRGFAPMDGPLNPYKDFICGFKKSVALVMVSSEDGRGQTEENVGEQAIIQLPELPANRIGVYREAHNLDLIGFWSRDTVCVNKIQSLFQNLV